MVVLIIARLLIKVQGEARMKLCQIAQGLSEKKYKHKGSLKFESSAARIYDKRAILASGIHAKTNFSYTKKHLEKMLVDEDDLIEYEILRDEELGQI